MLRLLGDRGGPAALKAGQAERFARVAFPDAHVLRVERVRTGRTKALRLTLCGAPSPLLLRTYAHEPVACARELAALRALPGVVPVADRKSVV